ncbi:MAG: CheR family methyltransferase, partial [Myxococcales bacterium]
VRAVPLPEPVALHLRALVHIERGERKRAQQELSDLARQVPEYVPGILERALLHVRLGEKSAATSLMREVLKRTENLPVDDLLPGPEPLPVSFYRDSAETFLRSSRPGLG